MSGPPATATATVTTAAAARVGLRRRRVAVARAAASITSPACPALALLLTVGAGCATAPPPPRMSFAEAGLVDAAGDLPPRAPARPAAPPRAGRSSANSPGEASSLDAALVVVPPVAVPAPESVPSEPPEGPAIDPLLLRFAAEARGRRLAARPGRGFPPEGQAAWSALLTELDAYLLRPLPQTPLLELVRAQVTVEAELDFDQRRYGQAPDGLDLQVRRRAARLGVRILAARTLGQTMFVARPPGKLRWPLEGAGLSSVYGQRLHPFTGERHWHAGIDLATERGRLVGAATQGYVVRAGWAGGYGLLVEVRHPGDVTTRYGHLSAVLCSPGDQLAAGQALGAVGSTGISTGPHLHFEVWRGGRVSDPLEWLGGGSMLATPAASGGPR